VIDAVAVASTVVTDAVFHAFQLAQLAKSGHQSGFHVKLFTEVFVTLLVIMDPIGTVPLFLALTSGRSRKARNRQAWQAIAVAVSVIAAFALLGQQILRYLGITVAALQGAGGLLLILVALELLTGKQTRDAEVPDVNVAFVPLGTPLLAGPGAIVATIVFVRRAHGFDDGLAIALGILAVHVVLYLSLRFSTVILRVVRDAGVSLITRISGLLLSAIAVQLVADSAIAFARTA
jgi:multiple antibiotic resistance protein